MRNFKGPDGNVETAAADIDRQLWEIDENLMRAELSPTEMAEHLAKREELWEMRETQVGKVCPPEKPVGNKSPPKQKKGFAADTAEKTGVPRARGREFNSDSH